MIAAMRVVASLLLFLIGAVSTAAGAARPDLVCAGAAPDWSLEIGAAAAVMTAPDLPQIDYAIPDEKLAEGRDWPRVLTLLAQTDTALALIGPGQCAATPAGGDWRIQLLTQKMRRAVLLTGCCRLRTGE